MNTAHLGLLRGSACLVALTLLATGCGGGSSGSGTPSANDVGDTPPVQIQGVATPGSVAVVTATNAD